MAIEYTNQLNSKALQNLLKLGFFGLKIDHLAALNGTEFLNVCLYKQRCLCHDVARQN
jgi:hypothetical protein